MESDELRGFADRVARFRDAVRAIGRPDVANYYWYHTVDLGDGLVTPGLRDFRDVADAFGFPTELSGKRVLDVGSATGFFAFEFERRGADVTSLEIPSLDALDRFPGQTTAQLAARIRAMAFADSTGHAPESSEQLYEYLLDGPFRFCASRLQSKVRRCYGSIYDLSLQKLGAESGFDLVFIGDVIWHTLNPVAALAAASSVCNGTLILAQAMGEGNEPMMVYRGGSDPDGDDGLHWWLPNAACFTQILYKLGFHHVETFGTYRVPGGVGVQEGTIIHARR